MKDKRNWSSELKQENVSIGLDKVSYKLDGKVVCLHTDMKYGVPDALTVYMVTNFKELGIKKLINVSSMEDISQQDIKSPLAYQSQDKWKAF